MSSDDEKPASDHSDEDDENDDLEPSVTFYVNPLNAEDEVSVYTAEYTLNIGKLH